MLSSTFFEILPDEIILHACQYLRGADVFYSFYNLNARLNVTIAGYCRYVNLMAVPYKQFEYSVSHVLPQIGSSIRSFLLNGNWETIINEKLSSILYSSNLPLLFPQLQRLIIKSFTSERFLSFIDILQNFPQLIELDIRLVKGEDTIDLIQSKILSANNNRLSIVIFDEDSTDFNISDDDTTIVYPNIRELTINLTLSKLIPRLFSLVPNICHLHISIDEISTNLKSKLTLINLSSLVHLITFKLRSTTCFWTFDEITSILKAMPFLQQLALNVSTEDKRLVSEDNLNMILPSSVIKLDFFIAYYYPESISEDEVITSLSSTRFPIAYMLDKSQPRCFLIHTIPCDLRSAILTATISKHMLSGWNYTRKIEDLCIYDITSLLDLLLILQHFRRIRILSIEATNKSEILTLPSPSPSIDLKLPYLKQITISGKYDLFPVLNAAPNLDHLIIDFDFDYFKTLLDNEPTCHQLRTKITRLTIVNWIDVKSDLLKPILQIFSSLHYTVIIMKDPTLLIDDFVLTILSIFKEKSRISIDVNGSLPDETKENLRQWIIDYSHIRVDDSFVVGYNDNWFGLWF